MKKILLKIDDDVFSGLEQAILVSHITGNFYGTRNEFLALLINSINNSEKEIHIVQKKEKTTKQENKP